MVSQKNVKKTVNTLLAAGVALTMAGAANSANAMGADKEKCYGVVEAGHNDCANASGTHSCAGHASADADGGEWIAVPAGLCDKLAGGSTTPVTEEADDMGDDHAEDHGDDHGDSY